MNFTRFFKYAILFLFVFTSSIYSQDKQNKKSEELENIYRQAQFCYLRKDYSEALKLFQQYIEISKNKKHKSDHLMYSIDRMGRIYLMFRRDPDIAIEFYNNLLKDERLSDAEQEQISEWIAAAQDWKKIGNFPKMTSDKDKQFELGKKFYLAGINKRKYPKDFTGNADFAIAESYLIPFIIENDADNRIGDALYMMGDLRRSLNNDKLYWSERFYLKEVIRRFPNTELAQKAYRVFEEDIYFDYSGSSGTKIPLSVKHMLQLYKNQAFSNPEHLNEVTKEKKQE